MNLRLASILFVVLFIAAGCAQSDQSSTGSGSNGSDLAASRESSADAKAPSDGLSTTRMVGDRFACEKCGAALVYEKPCNCAEGMPHSEICCGEQMKPVKESAADKSGDQ